MGLDLRLDAVADDAGAEPAGGAAGDLAAEDELRVVGAAGAPLGLITEAVQALAGVLLPSASVFLLLLCNDREVLGPWRNHPGSTRSPA